MARGMSPLKIIGFVVLIAGIAVAVLGIYQLVQYNTSLFGKMANSATRLINRATGSLKVADKVLKPILLIAAGTAGAIFGFTLARKG